MTSSSSREHLCNTPLVAPAGCYAICMEKRTCTTCGNSYDDTKQFFRRKDEDVCTLCVRKRNKEYEKRKAAKRSAALRRIEAAGIDLYAEMAAKGGSNIPHSAEVLERIFQYFGGVSGFASIMVKQYYDSPPGGTARNRLLETIVRLVSKNVEQGGAKKPLTLWTEEELEAELDSRFQQALNTYKGITVDAKALPSPEDTSPASDPGSPVPDGIPEGRDQDPAIRTPGAEAGGSKAVPPDAVAGEDPPVQGP